MQTILSERSPSPRDWNYGENSQGKEPTSYWV